MTVIADFVFIGHSIGKANRKPSHISSIPKSQLKIPNDPIEEFQRAVQYVTPDGKISSAAEASFLFTLSHAPRKKLLAFPLIENYPALLSSLKKPTVLSHHIEIFFTD